MQDLIYVVLSLFNVIISTIKSSYTVNGTKVQAVIANTIAYTFNVVVMKQLSAVSYTVAIISTLLTNLLGVGIGRNYTDKYRPIDPYLLMAITKNAEIAEQLMSELNEVGIDFIVSDVHKRSGISKKLEILCNLKEETKAAVALLKKYDCNYSAFKALKGV